MRKTAIFCLFLIFSGLQAQELDSLMQGLAQNSTQERVTATFKSPRLVLLQTDKTLGKQYLTFWIGHRFGDIGGESGGSHSLFGLDAATDIHIGFDYGVTHNLTLGIGRSKFNETYNFQGKYRLLYQGERVPFSLTLFAQSSWITREEFFDNEFDTETDRISHFLQLILAKKISPSLSVMLNPGYLMGAEVEGPLDKKNIFVLGMGGRLKLTKRFSLIADYTLVNGLDGRERPGAAYYNPLGIGLEIETGGHVFSLNFQNATYITENNFLANTQKSWRDGGVRFGFSISRDFYLGSKNSLNEQEP